MSTERASDAAIARAVKRHVWKSAWRMRASCALGLEDLLAREVGELPGVRDAFVARGAVWWTAPFDTIYAALLRLRVADTVRLSVGEGAAATFAMARDQLGRIPWAWWLPPSVNLEVRVRSSRSRLRDGEGLKRFVLQAVQQHGVAVSESAEASATVLLSLEQDRAEAWLDLSGDPLYRRRGDRWVSRTSLRETTAAAMALAVGVEDADVVFDPFCGSGTVLEEAAGVAMAGCAGEHRSFALEAAPVWRAERMRHAQRVHCSEVQRAEPGLVGGDVDGDALEAARHNLAQCGLDSSAHLNLVDARAMDFRGWMRELDAHRPVLLSNPPYGRRADAAGGTPDATLSEVLARVADVAREGPAWRVGILYPRPEVVRAVAGFEDLHVTSIRMRGLATALVTGTVNG